MTDDADSIRERRDRIESKLDAIEGDGWTVVDYDPTLDPYEPVAVEVVLRYDEPTPELPIGETAAEQVETITNIKDVVKTVDSEHPDEPGAPIDAVRDRAAAEFGIDRDVLDAELEKLRTKGDVYSPDDDQFKAV